MDPNHLSAVNLFDTLSTEQAADLVQRCQQRSYAVGEVIFREDDVGEELYILESGDVGIHKSLSLDAEHTLAHLTKGSIFGEMAVLGAHTRSATARARTPTTLLVMEGDNFRALVDQNPLSGLKLLQALILTLIHRLSLTNDLLRDALAWGLEVSGASSLNFHKLMSDRAVLNLDLIGGKKVQGRLVGVDRDGGGVQLMIFDTQEHIHIVPYHAIVDIVFDFALPMAQQGEDEAE